jgi:hypothetical protein
MENEGKQPRFNSSDTHYCYYKRFLQRIAFSWMGFIKYKVSALLLSLAIIECRRIKPGTAAQFPSAAEIELAAAI